MLKKRLDLASTNEAGVGVVNCELVMRKIFLV